MISCSSALGNIDCFNIPSGAPLQAIIVSFLSLRKICVITGGFPPNGYSSYFPFLLRQKPGCDNSLGRLKFDFDNPYHVYIHDTNVKFAFLAKKRFLSHGCMRVEKPYELAVALGIPPEKIDMADCLENKKPEIIPLPNPVPVFVIYATINVVNGQLQWHEDAYHKIRKLK